VVRSPFVAALCLKRSIQLDWFDLPKGFLMCLLGCLKFNGFPHLWESRWQAETLLDETGERTAVVGFTMNQDDSGFAWRHDAKPMYQIGLSGMGTESAQSMDLCFDRNFLAENADLLLTVDQSPT